MRVGQVIEDWHFEKHPSVAMSRIKLSSGKSFDWDGKRFRRDGDDMPPTIPEVEELSDLLQREAPKDFRALTEYLRTHYGASDVKRIRGAVHAVEWIEEGPGRYLRTITATELKSCLLRGKMRCVWCGNWLADDVKGKWWCPDGCEDGFLSRCDRNYIKGLVEERDKGRCKACGEVRLDWDMDHIVPVHQGGGLCDLSNYQTLCYLCHQNKTAEQRQDGADKPSPSPHKRKKVLLLSESPPDRLRDLASSIREIPSHDHFPAHRLESAARRLHLAIKSGAFSDEEYKPLQVAFLWRIEAHKQDNGQHEIFNEHIVFKNENSLDGMTSAWGEVIWWLRGKPEQKTDIWATSTADCGVIADLIDAEAIRLERGNPACPIWQMTRSTYHKYCESESFDDFAKNNRLYWRQLEVAAQFGRPIPDEVRAGYEEFKRGK